MGSQRQSTKKVLSTKNKNKDKNRKKKIRLIFKRDGLGASCLKPGEGAVRLRDLMSEEEVIRLLAEWLMAVAEQRASDRSPGAFTRKDRKASSIEG